MQLCFTQMSLHFCSFLVEELSAKVEDGKDEIKTLKRKHVNNVKVSKNLIGQCMEITVLMLFHFLFQNKTTKFVFINFLLFKLGSNKAIAASQEKTGKF